MAAATATPRKPREVTYFEMTGTAEGPKMRLTKPSIKALTDARDVCAAMAKAGSLFPLATCIQGDLEKFLADPTALPSASR